MAQGFAVIAILSLTLSTIVIPSTPAYASACIPCATCDKHLENGDVGKATGHVEDNHDKYEDELMEHISDGFSEFRSWLEGEFFGNQMLPALMLFTEQMTAVAMDQAMIIGMFLDAKHQLETQRLLQELENQAHKDYHPSEDFCWFGTGVRSMAASEQLGHYNAIALSTVALDRQLGNVNISGSETRDRDKANRWQSFIKKYCDIHDNNWIEATAGTGLKLACGVGGGNTKRINIDVDYTRAIEEPRTLDVNFTDAAPATNDEQDIIALSDNLYGHDVLTRNAEPSYLKNKEYQHLYLALRSVAAKRSVAQNSFNAIVGLKSAGTIPKAGDPDPGTNKFLGAILVELGVPAGDVYKIIGENPSYYAQLELLAKKIYQNPDFYSNLYDKPANVKRKSVALKAISVMLDRAIYESQLRQEMTTSVLLSSRLRNPFRAVNKDLGSAGED